MMLAIASLSIGCAGEEPLPKGGIHVEAQHGEIVRGEVSGADQNEVVLLVIGGRGECSGTLVAPNLVLTARHCVSVTDVQMACAPNGNAFAGGRIYADYPPEDVVVYVGSRRDRMLASARGAQIVHDGSRNLCNHDLAFVVLDRAIEGAPIAPLRLTDTTSVGESITAVGWGLTITTRSPVARMQRRSVAVLDVGPSQLSSPNAMTVGESICSGDSGGPALSAAGAVVGVVSSGGNGLNVPTWWPALGCLGRNARNQYMRLAPFADLVREAFAEAGQKPLLERP